MVFVSSKYYRGRVGGGGWRSVEALVGVGTTVVQGREGGLSAAFLCGRGVIKPGGLIPSQVSAIPYGERRVILFVCFVESLLFREVFGCPLVHGEPGLWGGNHETKLSPRPPRTQRRPPTQSPRAGSQSQDNQLFLSPSAIPQVPPIHPISAPHHTNHTISTTTPSSKKETKTLISFAEDNKQCQNGF